MNQAQVHLIPRIVERFKALADETRIRLLVRLQQSPANVNTLSEELGVAQASTSKHLSVLRQVGLVESDRQGTSIVYRLSDDSIEELCRVVCGGVIKHLKAQQALIESDINPAGPASRAAGPSAAAGPLSTTASGAARSVVVKSVRRPGRAKPARSVREPLRDTLSPKQRSQP